MMLLGDMAVDDRKNQINMHRADYLLRVVSEPWRRLLTSVPLYASWHDHDYLNNVYVEFLKVFLKQTAKHSVRFSMRTG
jgi:hypothetical protein